MRDDPKKKDSNAKLRREEQEDRNGITDTTTRIREINNITLIGVDIHMYFVLLYCHLLILLSSNDADNDDELSIVNFRRGSLHADCMISGSTVLNEKQEERDKRTMITIIESTAVLKRLCYHAYVITCCILTVFLRFGRIHIILLQHDRFGDRPHAIVRIARIDNMTIIIINNYCRV